MARFFVGFPKPKDYIPGWDLAGRVEAVGDQVTEYQPGDEVFAGCPRTLVEYVCVTEDKLAMKPTVATKPCPRGLARCEPSSSKTVAARASEKGAPVVCARL